MCTLASKRFPLFVSRHLLFLLIFLCSSPVPAKADALEDGLTPPARARQGGEAENLSPEDGAAAVTFPVILEASVEFEDDLDIESSHWQIRAPDSPTTYSETIFDSGVVEKDDETFMVPAGVLEYGASYYWRARFLEEEGEDDDEGSGGDWSDWSEETSFTTYIDYALEFDGTNDFVFIPSDPSLDLRESFTISAWVMNNGDSSGQIVWRGDTQGGRDPYLLQLQEGRMEFRIMTDSGEPYLQAAEEIDTAFHFWTAVHDKTANAMHLYRDGDLIASRDGAPDIGYDTSSMWNLFGAVDTGNGQFFSGALGEVRIWNRPRSEFEIRRDMATVLKDDEEGLAGYWTFREGEGQTAGDLTANGNVGRLGNAAEADDADPAWVNWLNERSVPEFPPSAPGNVSPEDMSDLVSATPLLQATDFQTPSPYLVQRASQWQIRLASSPGDYSETVLDAIKMGTNLTSQKLSFGTLDFYTSYYWRVRYQDANEAWSGWSNETVFLTTHKGAVTPVNLSPAEGATRVSLTPTLTGSAFIGARPEDTHQASRCQARRAGSPAGYAVLAFDSGETAANLISVDIPVMALEYATSYLWRVQYQNDSGEWSEWSNETGFSTVNGNYAASAFIPLAGEIEDVLLDETRNRFWVLRKAEGRVEAYDLTSGAQLASIRTGLEPESFAMTYDKRYLGVGSRGNIYLTVVDLNTDLSDRLGFFNSVDLQKVFRVTSIGTSDFLFVTRPDRYGSPPTGGHINIWYGDTHEVDYFAESVGAQNILGGLPPSDRFLVGAWGYSQGGIGYRQFDRETGGWTQIGEHFTGTFFGGDTLFGTDPANGRFILDDDLVAVGDEGLEYLGPLPYTYPNTKAIFNPAESDVLLLGSNGDSKVTIWDLTIMQPDYDLPLPQGQAWAGKGQFYDDGAKVLLQVDGLTSDGVVILGPPRREGGDPSLDGVTDNLDGSVKLAWSTEAYAPLNYVGFAYDLYTNTWVDRAPGGSIWYGFAPGFSTGDMELTYSGGYFSWISSLYPDGTFYPCANPRAFIMYGGTPHKPLETAAEGEDDLVARLDWKPDIYGTWLYWIIAYHVDSEEWVETEGPLDESLWHYVLYGEEDFMAGSTELTVPDSGEYHLFIAAMSWDAQTWGEFSMVTVDVP